MILPRKGTCTPVVLLSKGKGAVPLSCIPVLASLATHGQLLGNQLQLCKESSYVADHSHMIQDSLS